MAESDGGAESTQQQIDISRRKLFTEETDITISSMRITRQVSRSKPSFSIFTTQEPLW